MCGIAGAFHRDGRPIDVDALVRMTRTLEHRGPDEEGYYVNAADAVLPGGDAPLYVPPPSDAGPSGHVGLGHRRLSIIDLASGQQPLSNEDGTIWVTYNGEIYNFQELAEELEAAGHRFRTRCDTEVIVHAYEEWGVEGAVRRFRGMFAIALWDQPRQRLVLYRDRPGKKPLYYLADERRVLFGSEIKAILAAPDVPRDVDLEALSDYLSLLYVPAPKSIFRAIRKLPAAHYAVVTRDGVDVRPYWDLSFAPRDEEPEAIREGIVERLEEATRMRMISDVPLGAFLSGGVDSSAVVAMMAGVSERPVKTNAISFSVAKYDEARYAKQVAELFSTEHRESTVTPEAIPVVERLSWNYDEPFADSSSVPTYYVSKMARESVIVALSGDGGDENFAGYRRHWFDARENLVRNLVPGPLRRPLFATVGALYPKADYLPRIFRGKAFLSNVARDPVEAYFFTMSALYGDAKQGLLNGDVRSALRGYETGDLFRYWYDRADAPDHLSKIQYVDIKTYLVDDILTKVDRASMAVSLEVRCPILDHAFMEYVAGIPSRHKLRGTDGKHVFKQALASRLPQEILYRPKMGFGVPILEWLRGDLAEYAEARILEGPATRAWLDGDRLRGMWQEHQRRLRNRATELWAVLMLNLWYARFVEDRAVSGGAS